MRTSLPIFIAFIILFSFLSCKKERSCESCIGMNRPPVANAGSDITIAQSLSSVNLDGSPSTDPDNNISSYLWTQISGPNTSNIADVNAMQTRVSNLTTIGLYLFELKVIDTEGLFDSDTVLVNVTQLAPPTVQCGAMCALSTSCYWSCVSIPGTMSIQYTCHHDFYQSYGASAATQSKAYFAGGHDDFWQYGGSSGTGIEYDPVNNSSRCFSLSVPRSFLTGVVVGNKVIFAGGKNVSGYSNNSTFNTVDIIDPQTLTSTVASLSEARAHLASVSTGDRAYFIGGKTESGYSNKIDIYNSANNSWQVVIMPRERGYAGATIIANSIYIAGGKNNSGNIRTIDIYNIQSGLWTTIETPNDHPYASVATVNDKLIIAGGDGANHKSADIYNITTGQWTSVDLSSSRFNMTVSVVNNTVIFLGGAHSFQGAVFLNESDTVDIYDGNTGNWSTGSVSPVSGLMAASVGSQLIYTGFMWTNSGITYISNAIAIATF